MSSHVELLELEGVDHDHHLLFFVLLIDECFLYHLVGDGAKFVDLLLMLRIVVIFALN